jgi:hypothetical protein
LDKPHEYPAVTSGRAQAQLARAFSVHLSERFTGQSVYPLTFAMQ